MSYCSLKNNLLGGLFVVGVIFLLFGAFAIFLVPGIISRAVQERTYLGEDGNGTANIVLRMFEDPPYDIKLQVWTFSIQNADEVMRGKKPVIVEKGPYTFNVFMHKNVSFAANGTRLYFRQRRTYYFSQSQSCGNCFLSDSVIVPNIIFQYIVDLGMKIPGFLRKILELVIKNRESVFINVTVDQLLFDGYQDALISKFCDNPTVKMLKICEGLNIPNRIGLFYKQNGTDDGLYEVDTGLHDVDLLDRVYSWNGMDGMLKNDIWYNGTARMINGTDAELFRPNLYNIDKLQIFIGQLCRSFDLEKRGTAITSDIPVYRYSQPDSTLDVDVQRVQGFCNPKTPRYFDNQTIQQAGCAPSGLLDMQSCLPGKPRILWSNAHFRNAPAELRFDGMASPSEMDISYFDIEPITGVVVSVQQKSQLNLGMLRGNLAITKKMSNMILPMIWINESAMIDPATKEQLQLPLRAMYYSFAGGIGFLVAAALCFVIFAGALIGLKIAEHRRNDAQIDPDEATSYTPLVVSEQPNPTSATPSNQQQMPSFNPAAAVPAPQMVQNFG